MHVAVVVVRGDDELHEVGPGAVAQRALGHHPGEALHVGAHVRHEAQGRRPGPVHDLDVPEDPRVRVVERRVYLQQEPYTVVLRVRRGLLHDLGRGVDDGPDDACAEPDGDVDVLADRGDLFLCGEPAARVALGVQEQVRGDGRGAVLLHPSVPRLDELVGEVRIADDGLLRDDLDAVGADAGRGRDAVLQGHRAQEVLLLEGVQAHAALDGHDFSLRGSTQPGRSQGRARASRSRAASSARSGNGETRPSGVR